MCNHFRIFAFHREKEGHVFLNPHYHRVEEGQEPVNLTGGPLAYKYQFQEMFFHWGEKVNMVMMCAIFDGDTGEGGSSS